MKLLPALVELIQAEAFSGVHEPEDCAQIRADYEEIMKLANILLSNDMLENMLAAAKVAAKEHAKYGDMWQGASGFTKSEVKQFKTWATKFEKAKEAYTLLLSKLEEKGYGQKKVGSV